MRPRRSVVAALFMTALLVVSGCGAAPSDRVDAGREASGSGVDLNFAGTTVDGERFDGQQLAGKPAVLWFWAPWCPTCRSQTPTVNSLAETYADRVNVVGVGGLADAAAIRGYASNIGDHVTLLVDEEGVVWEHFGVTAQSTYVVLDADGQIVAQGYLDDATLAEHVAGLVD